MSAVDLLAVGVSVEWGSTTNPLVPLLIVAAIIVVVIRWAS